MCSSSSCLATPLSKPTSYFLRILRVCGRQPRHFLIIDSGRDAVHAGAIKARIRVLLNKAFPA